MSFANILKKAREYLPSLDEGKLLRAYNLARKAHHGQKRRDGQPYIVHPVAVAEILTDLFADLDTLIAALLHDVVEDTPYTTAHIRTLFGQNVVDLVDGVTKLKKAQYPFDKTARKMESLKKFFRLSKQDLRVILIKLADRLHNMRTIKSLPEKRRIKLATETQDIYIPIANLLGIWSIKKELEDLCFECIKPAQYKKILDLYRANLAETQPVRDKTVEFIGKSLKKNGFKATIFPQDKSLFAYFKNCSDVGFRKEVFRPISFNVIVPKKKDCYTALCVFHSLFKPLYSKIKDYIATPKANNYRSLHTVVFGINGIPTSFRIRTPRMQRIDEYGMLADIYKYSAVNPQKASNLIRKETRWLEKVLEISNELPSDHNFLDNLKMDILNSRIFAFTPKGDIVDLPEGATVLDFAYAVHSDIGNKARSAEIDGIDAPLSRQLQTGDTIKIVTGCKTTLRLEWLNIVKTNDAKQRIKAYFKEKGTEKSHIAGKKLLEETIRHFQKKNLAGISVKKIGKALDKFHAKNLRELLVMVGNGEILPKNVIKEIFSKEEILTGNKAVTGKTGSRSSYPVEIVISYIDRIGLFKDIATTIMSFNVNINKISVKTPEGKSKKGLMELILGIRELNQLMDVFAALEQIENIIHIQKK
jgi:GTP diphosphokinase / guanosine-3',5'-bis(diphosphate) 3'-diphosphatase